jgi:SAM-dependent methyltransferase
MTRPLYGRFAWAYDSIVRHPAGGTLDQVATRLRSIRLGAGSLVIDAGCGTGRLSAALAARGFRVIGLDRSDALIDQARGKTTGARFVCGDLLQWRPPELAAAVLCRGVLNDLTADEARRNAFVAFASWLEAGGVLLADVREWEATATRYASGLRHQRGVTDGGRALQFSSETSLDPAHRRMVVHERYVGLVDGVEVDERHDFAMRCWTADEVVSCARAAGFSRVDVIDGEDAGIAADRLLVVARTSS